METKETTGAGASAALTALTQATGEAGGDNARLLAEIRDLLLAQNAQKKRQLLLLRICAAAVAVLALSAVAFAAVLLPKAADTLARADAAIAALDMEQVDAVITELEQVAGESLAIAKSAGNVLSKVDELDFAALNDSIEELNVAVKKLSDLNVSQLNEAIGNLNDTVEPMANFFSAFR